MCGVIVFQFISSKDNFHHLAEDITEKEKLYVFYVMIAQYRRQVDLEKEREKRIKGENEKRESEDTNKMQMTIT